MANFDVFLSQIIHQCAIACNSDWPDSRTIWSGKILYGIVVVDGMVMLPCYQRTEEVDLVVESFAGNETGDTIPNSGIVRQRRKLNIRAFDTRCCNELPPFGLLGVIRISKQRIILVVGECKASKHVFGHGEVHLCRTHAAVGADPGSAVRTMVVEIIPNSL